MPLAPSALRVTYCLVVVPPASPLLGLPRCTTPVVASVCLTASALKQRKPKASKQALIRLYISSISAALLMASIEAQISAAFAADAPKTQFVRPTDADAWGGSTDKKPPSKRDSAQQQQQQQPPPPPVRIFKQLVRLVHPTQHRLVQHQVNRLACHQQWISRFGCLQPRCLSLSALAGCRRGSASSPAGGPCALLLAASSFQAYAVRVRFL